MKTFNKLRKKYGYEIAVKKLNRREIEVKIVFIMLIALYALLTLFALDYAIRNELDSPWTEIYALLTVGFIAFFVYKIADIEEEKSHIKIKNRIKNIESLLRDASLHRYQNEIGNIRLEYNVLNTKLTIKIRDKQLDLYETGWSNYLNGMWNEEVYDFCCKIEEDIKNIMEGYELEKTNKIKEIESLYIRR